MCRNALHAPRKLHVSTIVIAIIVNLRIHAVMLDDWGASDPVKIPVAITIFSEYIFWKIFVLGVPPEVAITAL